MERKREGGFLISKIHQLSGRIFNKLLKGEGIEEFNSAQGRILFVLWQKDDIPIIELSQKTQLGKSTLTAMLDRLEKDGFIERAASPEDRRKINVRKTKKSIKLERKYREISDRMIDLFYHGFRKTDIDQFEKYLRRILMNLENYPG